MRNANALYQLKSGVAIATVRESVKTLDPKLGRVSYEIISVIRSACTLLFIIMHKQRILEKDFNTFHDLHQSIKLTLISSKIREG